MVPKSVGSYDVALTVRDWLFYLYAQIWIHRKLGIGVKQTILKIHFIGTANAMFNVM